MGRRMAVGRVNEQKIMNYICWYLVAIYGQWQNFKLVGGRCFCREPLELVEVVHYFLVPSRSL